MRRYGREITDIMKFNYKTKPTDALVYLIYILASCIVGLALSSMLVLIVSSISTASYLALAIIRTFVFMVAGGGTLFLIGNREGYRTGEFDFRKKAYSWAVAYIIHFVISLISSFAPVLSGGARYMAGWMYLGDEFTALTTIRGGLYGYCVLTYLIYFAVNTACFTIAGYFGAESRVRSRAEITANQSADVIPDKTSAANTGSDAQNDNTDTVK